MSTPKYIRDYISEKFGDTGKISSNGREFIMPSLFVDNDWKLHLSINLDTGLWQDFKSGESGNFTKFYSIVENLPYRQAKAELLFKTFHLEEDIPQEATQKELIEEVTIESDLNEFSLLPIGPESCDSEEEAVRNSWLFLFERKLFDLENPRPDQYYICLDGKYAGRIIIPFKKNKCLFYFQARALDVNRTPKYLNPSSDKGVRPSTILYPFDECADHLVICEGPLDAISLQIQGINATCTLGSHLSEIQLDLLKYFPGKIILGYDNDEAGYRGIKSSDKLRKAKMMSEFYILHPPEDVKDWNEAHIKGYDLKKHLNNIQKYDYDYRMDVEFKKL